MSAGSHFEKVVFGDEMMVSDSVMDARLSQMTLAVAKDSGWYEVDLELGEHYFWGQNEGCDMFRNTCSTIDVSEFCKEILINGCDDSHTYQTMCSFSQFTGLCSLDLNVKSCKTHHVDDEPYAHGDDSKCLNTKVAFEEI